MKLMYFTVFTAMISMTTLAWSMKMVRIGKRFESTWAHRWQIEKRRFFMLKAWMKWQTNWWMWWDWKLWTMMVSLKVRLLFKNSGILLVSKVHQASATSIAKVTSQNSSNLGSRPCKADKSGKCKMMLLRWSKCPILPYPFSISKIILSS